MKPTTQQEAREAQLRAFTEYFVRNYPGPDTIIHNPQWHAARIFRAAEHAIAYHRPASTPGPVPLARVMEQFTPAEREEIAADAARLNAAVPVPDEAVERARAAYAFHAEHADHDDCLHAALTAAGYFALREERAQIVAKLGCHPGMLLAELDQVTERADATPNADDYRQLRAERDAYRNAVAGHSERWEAAEAERDALANKCSDAESEIRALRREVERLGNELARWEGESCGGDCLAAPCTYCDGTRRTTGRGKELEQQVADANERAEAAEAKLAASERYAERLREAARNVIAWDWSDNDEEPLADIAHLALVLKQADAARATTTQLSTSAEPNGSSAQQQGGE
jgi:hypothetical protein